MTSEEVRAAFVWQTMEAMGRVWTDDHCAYTTRQMADEIVRLREQLSAVTVTEAMVEAAAKVGCDNGFDRDFDAPGMYWDAMCKVVAAAIAAHPTTPTRGSDE